MSTQLRYDQLNAKLRDISSLESALSLFHWDQQTYMPKHGAEGRASQVATLAAVQHEKRNAPELRELLESLVGDRGLSAEQGDNVRLIKRELVRAWAVPNDLIRALAEQSARTHDVWLQAREQQSFSLVRKDLEKLIALKQEHADALLAVDSTDREKHKPCKSRYDALLDSYEPGARTATVKELFRKLGVELKTLLAQITAAKQAPYPAILIQGPFPKERQAKFITSLVRKIGFDFNAGRMDETVHPFCSTIGFGDIRLCTRYDESNLFSGLFGAIHEAGHGLYEQGLPSEHWAMPLGEACSLGIHESQSLLWEKIVGRSQVFWNVFYPELQSHFPETLKDVPLSDFYRFINRVQPSLIRINADEVTYSLHVILRLELEEALVNGSLSVGDLKGAWSERYQHYLGVVPENDTEGVLQDTHWYSGLIGYFPTYSIGAMAAAQLFDTFKTERGTESLCAGDYVPLLSWLQERVHVHGKRYDSEDLVVRVTGKPLGIESLTSYLTNKYQQLAL